MMVRQQVSYCEASLDGNIRFGFGFFRALETHDEGDGHAQLLSSFDDTFRDIVATHDASEDVDENALHIGVSVQDLKGLLDSLRGSTSVE